MKPASSFNKTVLMIDVTGLLLLAAIGAACAWLLAVKNEETSTEIASLREVIAGARQDLGTITAARDQQLALVADRESVLAELGRLPEDSQMDTYLQEISRLAGEHQVRIVSNVPLKSAVYPGLLEERYSYEISGTTLELFAFLRDVERTDFWADISHIKIESGGSASYQIGAIRSASLTLSLFSSPADDPSAETG